MDDPVGAVHLQRSHVTRRLNAVVSRGMQAAGQRRLLICDRNREPPRPIPAMTLSMSACMRSESERRIIERERDAPDGLRQVN